MSDNLNQYMLSSHCTLIDCFDGCEDIPSCRECKDKMLADHDKQIREEVIDEVINRFCYSEILSFRSKQIKEILEQMKGGRMSSGMNVKEAEKVAENMTYKEAVMNCLGAKCVPYRKATKIKMKQLLESIDNDFTDDLLNQGFTKGYRQGRANVIKEIDTIIDFVKSNSFDHSLEFDSFKAVGSSVIINLLEQLKEIE